MAVSPKRPLLGAIEPRLSNKPLTGKSRGPEVGELAASIGAPLMDWQQWILNDMLAVREDNTFIRRSSLAIISRQNGKSFIGRIRAVAGLVLFGEKNQLIMSSNRGMALTNFRDICYLLENSDELRKKVETYQLEISHVRDKDLSAEGRSDLGKAEKATLAKYRANKPDYAYVVSLTNQDLQTVRVLQQRSATLTLALL